MYLSQLTIEHNSDSSDDEDILQAHSHKDGPQHWKYSHWKVIARNGGFATVECECTELSPTIYKTVKELRCENREDWSIALVASCLRRAAWTYKYKIGSLWFNTFYLSTYMFKFVLVNPFAGRKFSILLRSEEVLDLDIDHRLEQPPFRRSSRMTWAWRTRRS